MTIQPIIDVLNAYGQHAEAAHDCDEVDARTGRARTEDPVPGPCAYCRVMAGGRRVPKATTTVYRVAMTGEDAPAACEEAHRLIVNALARPGIPGNARQALRAMKGRLEAAAQSQGWRLSADG